MHVSKLILGTVQLGLNYGINNSTGKPNLEQSFDILREAYKAGIRYLDTAEAYGDSQQIIGQFHKKYPGQKFNILTKFKSIDGNLREQFERSCADLSVNKLYSYSFHNILDVTNDLVLALSELKYEKKIEQIGVSVYENEQFLKAIDIPNIDIIQLPFNLFDNWGKRGDLINLARKKNKKIHVRSVFLQGLFYKDTNSYPDYLKQLIPFRNELGEMSKHFNVDISKMALSYVLKKKSIDGVLLGVESVSQLYKNLEAIDYILPEELEFQIDSINAPHSLLDPRNWK